MADTSILREFLVSLGFNIKPGEHRNFVDTVSKTTKLVRNLAEGLGLIGTLSELALKKIAEKFDELNFSAQKAGTTVGNLQAAMFGFSRIGISMGAATSAITAMGIALRNPALEYYMTRMGVTSRDSAVALDQYITGLKRLYGLNNYGFMVAQKIAQNQVGISPTDFYQYWTQQERMRKFYEDQQKRQAASGINADEFADKSQKFMDEWSRFVSEIGIVGQKISNLLLEPMRELLHELNEVLVKFTTLDDKQTAIVGAFIAIGGITAVRMIFPLLLRMLGLGGLLRLGAAPAAAAGAGPGAAAVATSTFLGGFLSRVLPWVARINAVGGFLWGMQPTELGHEPTSKYFQDYIKKHSIPVEEYERKHLSGSRTMFDQIFPGASEGLKRLGIWLSGSSPFVPRVQIQGAGPGSGFIPASYSPGGDGGGPFGGRDLPPRAGGRFGGMSPGAAATGSTNFVPPSGTDIETIRKTVAAAGGNTQTQAAFLAMMNPESGLDPSKVAPGGDASYAQWVGLRKRQLIAFGWTGHDREKDRIAAAKMLYWELTTNPQYKAMVQRMNNAPNPTEAARYGGFVFEQGRAPAYKFGHGRFDQAALDRFHSSQAQKFYDILTRTTGETGSGRDIFGPSVKFNSKGQPYNLTMTPQELANQAASYAFIKKHMGDPSVFGLGPDSTLPSSNQINGGTGLVPGGAIGGQRVSIEQNNEYHVTGFQPDEVFRHTAGLHSRTNGDLVRNLRGALA